MAPRLWVEIIAGGALKGDNVEFHKHMAQRERASSPGKSLQKWIWCPISVLMPANPKAVSPKTFPTVLYKKRGLSTKRLITLGIPASDEGTRGLYPCLTLEQGYCLIRNPCGPYHPQSSTLHLPTGSLLLWYFRLSWKFIHRVFRFL